MHLIVATDSVSNNEKKERKNSSVAGVRRHSPQNAHTHTHTHTHYTLRTRTRTHTLTGYTFRILSLDRTNRNTKRTPKRTSHQTKQNTRIGE